MSHLSWRFQRVFLCNITRWIWKKFPQTPLTLNISISRSNFISSISRVLRRFSYAVWCAEYVKNILKVPRHSPYVERLFRGQISFLPQTQQATAASPEMSRNILTFAFSMTQDQRRGRGEKVIPLGCFIFVSFLTSHTGVPCLSHFGCLIFMSTLVRMRTLRLSSHLTASHTSLWETCTSPRTNLLSSFGISFLFAFTVPHIPVSRSCKNSAKVGDVYQLSIYIQHDPYKNKVAKSELKYHQ